MQTYILRLALPVLLLASTSALSLAYPVKVRTEGGQSQTVTMCPDCSQPIACAKAGDYTVALAVDIDSPKNGGNVRLQSGLTNQGGAPVTNAKVAVVLSMTGHDHKPRKLQMHHTHGGQYLATTTFRSVDMAGPWNADVQITTPKGDVVTQRFTFNR
jgi:hypothetical protein